MNKIHSMENMSSLTTNLIYDSFQNRQSVDPVSEVFSEKEVEITPADVRLPIQANFFNPRETSMSRRDVQGVSQTELSEENAKIKENQGKILNVLSQYCAPVSVPENEFGVKFGMRFNVHSMVDGLKKKWNTQFEKGDLTKEKLDAQTKDVENILALVKNTEDDSLINMFVDSFFGENTNFYEEVTRAPQEEVVEDINTAIGSQLIKMEEKTFESEKDKFVQTLKNLLNKSKGNSSIREFLGSAIVARKYFSLYEKEGLKIILLDKESSNDAAFGDYDENEEMTLELGKFYDGDDLRNVYNLLNIFHEIGHMVLCLTLNECNFDEQTRAGLDDICAPYYDENDPKSNFFKELGGIPYKDKVSMDEVYKEFGEPWDGYMQEQMQMLGMFLCQDTLFLNAYGDLPLAIAAHEVWPDIAVYLKPTHKEDIDTSDANRLSAIDKTYSENFKKVKDFLLDVHHNNSEECLFGTFLQNLLHKLDEFETPEELFRISSDKVNEIGERISDEMGIPLTKEVKDVLDDIFLSPIWSDNFKKFFAEVSGMSSEKLDEYLGRYLLLSADEGNREWAKFDANEKRDTSHEMRVEFEDLL